MSIRFTVGCDVLRRRRQKNTPRAIPDKTMNTATPATMPTIAPVPILDPVVPPLEPPLEPPLDVGMTVAVTAEVGDAVVLRSVPIGAEVGVDP
jgi:hypothetical protein